MKRKDGEKGGRGRMERNDGKEGWKGRIKRKDGEEGWRRRNESNLSLWYNALMLGEFNGTNILKSNR